MKSELDACDVKDVDFDLFTSAILFALQLFVYSLNGNDVYSSLEPHLLYFQLDTRDICQKRKVSKRSDFYPKLAVWNLTPQSLLYEVQNWSKFAL